MDKPNNEILKVKQFLSEQKPAKKFSSDQKPPTPGRTPNRHRKIKDANLDTYTKIQQYTDKTIPNQQLSNLLEEKDDLRTKYLTPGPDDFDNEILLRSDNDKRKMKTGSVQSNYPRGMINFS